jgi:3-oxoacyl-[acyl-carrier protein] reductase
MESRHVLVTGGSRGLGATFVEKLLADGFKVSTCSRSKSARLDALMANPVYAERLYWAPCEVGNAEAANRFVSDAMTWAGDDGIYGLVNNAGIAQAGILASFPNVESEKLIQVNLLGAIHFARAVSQHLIAQGKGGRIINISSIIGSRGYNGLAAYSASKAGMDGLTRALARELGRRGVTVNSVGPGYVKTQMSSTLTPPQIAQIVNRTPLRRLATEDDVTALVRFLLGDAAGMITGQVILVDGGVSC